LENKQIAATHHPQTTLMEVENIQLDSSKMHSYFFCMNDPFLGSTAKSGNVSSKFFQASL